MPKGITNMETATERWERSESYKLSSEWKLMPRHSPILWEHKHTVSYIRTLENRFSNYYRCIYSLLSSPSHLNPSPNLHQNRILSGKNILQNLFLHITNRYFNLLEFGAKSRQSLHLFGGKSTLFYFSNASFSSISVREHLVFVSLSSEEQRHHKAPDCGGKCGSLAGIAAVTGKKPKERKGYWCWGIFGASFSVYIVAIKFLNCCYWEISMGLHRR